MYELKVTVEATESPKSYMDIVNKLLKDKAEANAYCFAKKEQTKAIGLAKWETIKKQLAPIFDACRQLDCYISIKCPWDKDYYLLIYNGIVYKSMSCMYDANDYHGQLALDNPNYPHILERAMRNWSNEIELFEQALKTHIATEYRLTNERVAYVNAEYNKMVGNN